MRFRALSMMAVLRRRPPLPALIQSVVSSPSKVLSATTTNGVCIFCKTTITCSTNLAVNGAFGATVTATIFTQEDGGHTIQTAGTYGAPAYTFSEPKLPTIDFEAEMKKAFEADMVKAEADATNLKAGLADATKQKVVLLPLKCSVRNCKDWNCATWCWCFENYGDQIQAWLDVYAARAGCLADEEDCICKPDGPGPVGPEGDPIDINVVPREWVRRPSQCCVHPAPPPLDSSPSLRARLATLITLHSSTHYMTQSRRRFAKSSSLRNSHTSASTR